MSFGRASLGVVEVFAAQLGLPVRAARDDSVSFSFATTGTLSITPAPDGSRILVGLARPLRGSDGGRLERALACAGLQPATGRLVRAGLSGDDTLHLVLELPEAAFELPTLDACLQELAALHDRAA